MEERQKVVLSSASLALVAFAWGTSYAIIKDTLTSVTPFFLMMLRFGLSTVLLGLVYNKKLLRIKRKDLQRGSVIGIFMFFSFFTLVTGIQYTTASKQSFLVGSYVLIVPFLAWMINFSAISKVRISVAYLVIVATVIAFVVQNVAQRYISSTSTALILTLEAAFGSVFAVFYLKETMTFAMILGCFIVLVGIITQETKWKFLKKKIDSTS